MNILQTTIWLIVIEVLLLALTIILCRLCMYRLAFLAIAIMILMPSGLSGCIVGAKMANSIAPDIVYDYDYVRSENIKVVSFEDGKYIFSNGEKVKMPNSLLLQLHIGFGYLLGSAIFFFPGLFIANRITRKYAPSVHNLLIKNRLFDRSV